MVTLIAENNIQNSYRVYDLNRRLPGQVLATSSNLVPIQPSQKQPPQMNILFAHMEPCYCVAELQAHAFFIKTLH